MLASRLWAACISGAGATRLPGESLSGLRKFSFFAALFVIFASLNGPIHDLSDDYLFSAHMVQHLLLTLAMPPLLLAGVPGWMLRPILRNPVTAGIARRLTKPVVCFTIFNVIIALWHIPVFYNSAMANHNIHIVEHLMFMSAAVLMWWPLLSPLPELPRLAYPGQMLYCFLMSVPMSIIAVYITMADRVLYPGLLGRAESLAALTDGRSDAGRSDNVGAGGFDLRGNHDRCVLQVGSARRGQHGRRAGGLEASSRIVRCVFCSRLCAGGGGSIHSTAPRMGSVRAASLAWFRPTRSAVAPDTTAPA